MHELHCEPYQCLGFVFGGSLSRMNLEHRKFLMGVERSLVNEVLFICLELFEISAPKWVELVC